MKNITLSSGSDYKAADFKTFYMPEGSATVTWSIIPAQEKSLEPERIIYNGRTTIVYWNDGSQNRSTQAIEDIFDEKVGFAICLLKKLYGKKVYGKKLYERMIGKAEKQNRNGK